MKLLFFSFSWIWEIWNFFFLEYEFHFCIFSWKKEFWLRNFFQNFAYLIRSMMCLSKGGKNMNVDKLVRSIKFDFSNMKYVALSKDSQFEQVSDELNKLWYSTETMSIATIDMYYRRTLDNSYPEYTTDKFLSEALELKKSLSQEFAKIKKERRN